MLKPHIDKEEQSISDAADKKQWDVVRKILSTSNASTIDPSDFGNALLTACFYKKWAIVDLLLNNKNISFDWKYLAGKFEGYYALHFLILHNKADLIRKLLTQFKDVINKQHNPKLPTALTLAAQNTQVAPETLACLLEFAPDLELTQDDKTATHNAAETEQKEKLKLLIEHGADITTSSEKNKSLISYTADNKKWDVVRIIAKTGHASKNDPENFGEALLTACWAKKWDIVDLLLDNENLLTNWRHTSGSFKGYHALHFLVLHNKTRLIKKMLRKFQGVINSQLNPKTPTPLTLAVENSQVTLATLSCLLENATDLDMNLTQDAKTALHFAAKLGLTVKAILLIQHGADTTIVDNNSHTALDLANFSSHTDTINAITIESLMQQKNDLSMIDLTDMLILTREQFDYILSHKKTLKDLGCKLHAKVDVRGLRFEDLELPCHAFSVAQYTDIVLGYLPDEKTLIEIIEKRMKFLPRLSRYFQEKWIRTDGKNKKVKILKLPCLSKSYSYDVGKRIGSLTNTELTPLAKWLQILCGFFTETGIQAPKQLEIDTSIFKNALVCFLSQKAVGFFAQRCKTPLFAFTEASQKKKSAIKEIQASKTLYQLLKTFRQYRDFAFENPYESNVFQLYLYLACMFARLNYPREALFPKDFKSDEVGARGNPIEDLDLDELIILKQSVNASKLKDEDSDFEDSDSDLEDFEVMDPTVETPKILLVDEVIDRLQTRAEFIDPSDSSNLNDEEIKTCLKHPKISQAVIDCHQSKLKELYGINLEVLKEINKKFKATGQALWNASTDSGGSYYDEAAADRAVKQFSAYMHTLDRKAVDILNRRKYYLNSRSRITSFEALFSKMTCDGCSGQLGKAIKQWAECFDRDANITNKETPYSKYLRMMPEKPEPMFPEMPEGYRKTDTSLSSIISTRSCV